MRHHSGIRPPAVTAFTTNPSGFYTAPYDVDLLSIEWQYVTGAVAGTRLLDLTVLDGLNTLWRKWAPAAITAVSSTEYWEVIAGVVDVSNQTVQTSPLPALRLRAGSQILANVTGQQAGDTATVFVRTAAVL